MDLIESAKTVFFGKNILDETKTVVCALSGGADSTALLIVLKELSGEKGFKLGACHLNHGLRGEDSDGDERFCAELCEKMGVELYRKKVCVKDLIEKHESLEEAARKVRYEFFEEAREHFGENSYIATAHNANDNAETVLFNMIRGTGLKGLCGIPPFRDRIIRPLIYVSRSEIEQFLKERGQTYVTDKTNFSEEITRNRIRLKILPEMMKINPSVLGTISRMTKNLRSDSDLLEEMSEDVLKNAKRNNGFEASEIDKQSYPIKSRAVRKILINGGVEPSELRIKTALSLLSKRSARYNPCKNKFFTIRKGICFVENIEQKFGGFNEKHA